MYFTSVDTRYDGSYESQFPTFEQALEWINEHIDEDYSNHRIIEGRIINLEPAEVITKFRVKK